MSNSAWPSGQHPSQHDLEQVLAALKPGRRARYNALREAGWQTVTVADPDGDPDVFEYQLHDPQDAGGMWTIGRSRQSPIDAAVNEVREADDPPARRHLDGPA